MQPNTLRSAIPTIHRLGTPALVPRPGCPWADTMVLNPAIIQDPVAPDTYHMLFRATGPWPSGRTPGRPMPYPIFLGYAVSQDAGKTWDADFSRPALAPAMADTIEGLYLTRADGRRVVNHANGCIEDPRLFWMDGKLLLISPCRMFSPGPYWEHDEPMQCAPPWAKAGDHPFGPAASENVTVNVLFDVDLEALKNRRYAQAFQYRTHLTNPAWGEDRDVFPFSERLTVDGRPQVVMLQRPFVPTRIPGQGEPLPSIYLSHADDFDGFPAPTERLQLLARPEFPWERERIGASTPPLKIAPGRWLLPYHGKEDKVKGYSQSFMILAESANGLPKLIHRANLPWFRAEAPWEQPNRFATPCVFTTSVILDRGRLVMSYGAADERCGIAWADAAEVIRFVEGFDAEGRPL